jgi:uncharacterized protein with FMN-binding domain
VVVLLAACMASRLGRPVHPGELRDGVYHGEYSSFPNKARVEVTVKDGWILDVKLVYHRASSRGHEVDAIIPQRIVQEQSTSVDAVTGATNSSRVIMNAVEDALEQAK